LLAILQKALTSLRAFLLFDIAV